MSTFPNSIPRCQHIKVNGTQCGSPALRRHRFCFFHKKWHGERILINTRRARKVRASIDMPVLEDANSVQVAVMQIMNLILSGRIDTKSAGLLLYALQTASLNLKHTRFEPLETRVIIDPRNVPDTPLGADPWSEEDYEDLEDEEDYDHEDDDIEDDEEDDEQLSCQLDGDNPPSKSSEASRPRRGITQADVDLTQLTDGEKAIWQSLGFMHKQALLIHMPIKGLPPNPNKPWSRLLPRRNWFSSPSTSSPLRGAGQESSPNKIPPTREASTAGGNGDLSHKGSS